MKIIIENILISLITVLPLVLSLAFYTLAERKVMASLHKRQGPKMVGFWGIMQPIVDGLKLVLKELIIPSRSNSFLFLLAPIAVASISFASWSVIPFSVTSIVADTNAGLLLIFLLSSLNVYGLILAGWASNSKYALLGSLRAIAQMISYEIVFGVAILIIIYHTGTANLTEIVLQQQEHYNFFSLLPVSLIFFILIFAETNRAPFDLPEAESEIVAGYNVEYSSITFAMFFLAEYSNMILMSTLWVILFWGGWLQPKFVTFFFNENYLFFVNWLVLKTLLLLVSFIIVRATLPRYRFDQLMWIGWQVMFPILISFFLFLLGINIFFGNF